MSEKQDKVGNIIVTGFIISIVATSLGGLTGTPWLVLIGALAIIPFGLAVLGAFLDSLLRLIGR